METKEFKKIKRYDEYTINEFVKDLVDTRQKVEEEKNNITNKVYELDERLKELQIETSKDDTEPMALEEIKNTNEELQNLKDEQEKLKENLNKWENEKERIKSEIDKKIEKNEQRKEQKEKEITEYESTIEKNNEKINEIYSYSVHEANGMEDNTEELNAIEEENKKIKGMIDNAKRAIKRADKTNKLLLKIKENLEQENVLEDLVPPQTHSSNTPNKRRKPKQQTVQNKEEIKVNEWDSQHFETHRQNGIEGNKETSSQTNKDETVKTEPVQSKQPTEKVKRESVQVKKPTEKVKRKSVQVKKATEKAKTELVQPKKATETKKRQPVEVKQAEAKIDVEWNSKLTQEQIEELIADGIEPGDNEYNLYLWNHGINPFEDQMNKKQEEIKLEVDTVLEKYKNDGLSQNAFGWYFNPWRGEFDKDYDPHNDPEYNEKLEKEKVDKTEEVDKSDNIEKSAIQEKTKKVSLWQKIKDGFLKFINTIKVYIANFNNKQLPEGTENEQEKEEYIAKANDILKEIVSIDRVFDVKSRAAMQGRNQFVAEIHISKELREQIDAQKEVKEENVLKDVKEEINKEEVIER